MQQKLLIAFILVILTFFIFKSGIPQTTLLALLALAGLMEIIIPRIPRIKKILDQHQLSHSFDSRNIYSQALFFVGLLLLGSIYSPYVAVLSIATVVVSITTLFFVIKELRYGIKGELMLYAGLLILALFIGAAGL